MESSFKQAFFLAAILGGPVGLHAGPVEDLDAWLKTARASRPVLASQTFADAALTASECAKARDLIWTDRIAFVKSEWASQWAGKILVNKDNLQMPFDYRIYGSKPAQGYDLYISMHGGGETTKAENDAQWRNQIILYHPNGVYLAPRAPTDAWNMWHKDHIDGFFDQIIQLCVANLGANADRVYLMGYSAGGDGAYQMAPRMADRWAAAAMMAGYPNNASPLNLRNIGFSMDVGALDASFGRNTIAATYGKEMQKLQDADPGFYKYRVLAHPGKPHWMDLEDTVALSWIDDFTRHPFPAKVVWRQDTTVGTNSFPSAGPVVPVKGRPTQYQFHWIGLQERKPPAAPVNVTAEIKGQEVGIVDASIDSLVVLLSDSLLNLDKPVRVLWKGKPVYEGTPPRTIANLYQTAQDRGDRAYLYPVILKVAKSGQVSLRPGPERTFARVKAEGGSLAISFAGVRTSGRARLSDISGVLRCETLFSNSANTELPLRGLRSGMYIVSVRADGIRSDQPFFLP